jgi:hypothetical protein
MHFRFAVKENNVLILLQQLVADRDARSINTTLMQRMILISSNMRKMYNHTQQSTQKDVVS